MRTDIHSPARFDPQHYSFIGLIYIGNLQDAWQDPSDPEARAFINEHKHVGVHGLGQCDHCGAHHTYCWIWHYEGPGQHGWVSVGSDCSSGRFPLADRATFRLATMRKQVAAAREYGKKSAAVREALDANPILAEAIEWAKEAQETQIALEHAKANNPDDASAVREHETFARLVGYNLNIVLDIGSKLFRFGSVSDKQIAFAAKLAAEGAEKLAKLRAEVERVEAMEPLKAGRTTVEGTIKGIKYVEGYGYNAASVCKVIIALDSGHTIYGTAPEALHDAFSAHFGDYILTSEYRGCRIRMTLTIDPKVGDNDFAIFKRPTKPEILDFTAAEQAHTQRAEEVEREREQDKARRYLENMRSVRMALLPERDTYAEAIAKLDREIEEAEAALR